MSGTSEPATTKSSTTTPNQAKPSPTVPAATKPSPTLPAATKPSPIPPKLINVPSKSENFDKTFAFKILEGWFKRNDIDAEKVDIIKVSGKDNSQQGLLSTTYLMDVEYKVQGDDELKTKSVFIKVPLKGEAGAPYKQMNVREYEMYENILPDLQKYLSENCTGFFCLGVPEMIYCNYIDDEVHDVFAIENLLATGFQTCVTSDLKIENGGKDYLRSTLETLAQLHGTGLVYKKSLGGNEAVINKFPNIEEQIQIQDINSSQEQKEFLKKHFSPFIRYVEELDPELKNITQYMRKMDGYLLQILQVLEDSNVGKLNTLCHGDAKPNNFMFRKIDLDFDDEEMKELACEGVESMLIDWQQGFLGSLCSDLMWCIYPFLEVNGHDLDLYEFTFKHYFQELKNVLETFGTTLEENGLPNNIADFRSLIRRGYVLEFMIVTSLRPVLNIKEPEKVMKWYKKLIKYEKRIEKGGLHKLLARKPPKLPEQDGVFVNTRYMDFLQFYFKIATSLGAFQEMGLVYFELMKNEMFKDGLTMKSIVKDKPKSSNWLKDNFLKCIHPQTTDKENEEVVAVDKKEVDEEQGNVSFKPKEEMIYVDEDGIQAENISDNKAHDTIYEDVQKPESETQVQVNVVTPKVETVVQAIEQKPKERSPSPPDPLRALASKLHSDILQYKESYTDFKTTMDDIHPLATENLEDETKQEDIVNGLEDLDMNSIGNANFINHNSFDTKVDKNNKPPSAVHPNISELALSGMVPNNSYSSTYGERNNLSTPLTKRKVSNDIDFTSQIVEEAVRKISTDRQTEDSDSIKTSSRDRKISVQSVDTRKDSFCSNLSKQELVDLLDQDEADWEEDGKGKDNVCKPILEEQVIADDILKDDNEDNNTKGSAVEATEEISIKDEDLKIDAIPTESENKNSILAWLNIAKTCETVTSADSDDPTSQDCVHGVLTLDWIGTEDNDNTTQTEKAFNDKDAMNPENDNYGMDDKALTPDIEPESENDNSIKAWLSLNTGNVEIGIESDLIDDIEVVTHCDASIEKVEDAKSLTTDIRKEEKLSSLTNIDKDKTEITEELSSSTFKEDKTEEILKEKDMQPMDSDEAKQDPEQESNVVKAIENSQENCNAKMNDSILSNQEDITEVFAILSEDITKIDTDISPKVIIIEDELDPVIQKLDISENLDVQSKTENRLSANCVEALDVLANDISKEILTSTLKRKNKLNSAKPAQESAFNGNDEENSDLNVALGNLPTDINVNDTEINRNVDPIDIHKTESLATNHRYENDPRVKDSEIIKEIQDVENLKESIEIKINPQEREHRSVTHSKEDLVVAEENQNSSKDMLILNLPTTSNANDTEVDPIDIHKTESVGTDQGYENDPNFKDSKILKEIQDGDNLKESTEIIPQESEHISVTHSKEDLVIAEENQNATKDIINFNDPQDWIHDNTVDFHLTDSKELSANASKEDIEDKMASSKSISILRRITVDVKTANARSSEALDNDEDLPTLIDSTPSSVIEDLDIAPFGNKSTKPKPLRNGRDLKERKEMAKSMEIFEYIAENIDQPIKNLLESSHINGKEKSIVNEEMTSMRHAASNQEISYLSMDQLVGGQEKVLVDFPVSGSASTSSLDKEQVKAKIVEYFTKLVKEEKMSRDLGKNMDENSTNDSSLDQSGNESRNSPTNEEVVKDLNKSEEEEVNSEEKNDISENGSEEKKDDLKEDADEDERETSPKSGASTLGRRRKSIKKNKKKRKSKSYV